MGRELAMRKAGNSSHPRGGCIGVQDAELREVQDAVLVCAAKPGVLDQRLYSAGGITPDLRVVILARGEDDGLPFDLQLYPRFDATRDFPKLLAWLTGKPELAGAAAA